MNEIPENRRVRMTRRLMKDAMLELLEQMELSDISGRLMYTVRHFISITRIQPTASGKWNRIL